VLLNFIVIEQCRPHGVALCRQSFQTATNEEATSSGRSYAQKAVVNSDTMRQEGTLSSKCCLINTHAELSKHVI